MAHNGTLALLRSRWPSHCATLSAVNVSRWKRNRWGRYHQFHCEGQFFFSLAGARERKLPPIARVENEWFTNVSNLPRGEIGGALESPEAHWLRPPRL